MGTTLVGTPDTVIRGIERLQELSAGGFGGVLFRAHEWANREQTLKSYELFARYVMPRFQGSLGPIRELQRVGAEQPQDHLQPQRGGGAPRVHGRGPGRPERVPQPHRGRAGRGRLEPAPIGAGAAARRAMSHRAARCPALAGRPRVVDQRLSVLSPRPLRVRQLLLHPGRAGSLAAGSPAELAPGGHGPPADHRRRRPPRRLRARQPRPVSPPAAGDGLPDVRILRAAVRARPRDRRGGRSSRSSIGSGGSGRSSSSPATRPPSASGGACAGRTATAALLRRATPPTCARSSILPGSSFPPPRRARPYRTGSAANPPPAAT